MNTPDMIPASAPEMVRPMSKVSWQYVDPGELANEGIYSQEDLKRISEQIMFPIERPAMLSAFARGISGRGDLPDDLTLVHLLDERTLKRF